MEEIGAEEGRVAEVAFTGKRPLARESAGELPYLSGNIVQLIPGKDVTRRAAAGAFRSDGSFRGV
jgi:hypothetical protein